MQFQIIETNGVTNVTLFFSDGTSLIMPDTHPAIGKVIKTLREDPNVAEDDIRRIAAEVHEAAKTVERIFAQLTDQVAIRDGKLYVDGDKLKGPISKHIRRMYRSGKEDQAEAVATFLEKLQANPSEYARDNLWVWLASNDFTITIDGDFIAYKGMAHAGCFGGYVIDSDSDGLGLEDRVFGDRAFPDAPTSKNDGRAIVNGQTIVGYIPNPVGATVEMPRSEVDDGAHTYCSTGLHAGTYDFAHSFSGSSTVAAILVNPRDVVSVPDAGQKLRVCRYKVLEYVDGPYDEAVLDLLPESLADQLDPS